MGKQISLTADEALGLANEAAANGDKEKAIKYYEAVLVSYPDHQDAMAGVRKLQPNALFRADLDELEKLYEDRKIGELEVKSKMYLELYPEVYQLRNLLGAALVIQGKHTEALPHLEKAVELMPLSAEPRFNMANVYKALGDEKNAIKNYIQTIELKPGHVAAMNNLGNLLMLTGDYEGAVETFVTAVTIMPNSAALRWNAGRAYKAKGDLDEAIIQLKESIVIDGTVAEVLLELASCLVLSGDPDEARTIYEVVTTEDPENLEAFNNYGIFLHENGEYEAAITKFERAIDINPNFPVTYNNLGSLYRDIGDFTRSVENLTRSLELKPNAVEVMVNLADVHKACGMYEKAIEIYEQVHHMVPTGSVTITNLVILSFLVGDDEKAAGYLKLLTEDFIKGIRDYAKRHFCSAYKVFLDGLLEYNKDKERFFDDNAEKLWVIGGSVALIAKGHMAKVGGEDLLIDGKWVIGGKAFHIGKPGNNMFKASVKHHLSEMAEDTHVLYMFGSIDCRLDEGIIPVAKKTGKDVSEVVTKTVGDYFKNAVKMSRAEKVIPPFASVPAPYFLEGQEESKELIDVIIKFNAELKKQCENEGIQYVDTYSITDAGNAMADGSKNIDTHHVHPSVIVEALAS